MSVNGTFGNDAIDRYSNGVKMNSVFLYVSGTTRKEFESKFPDKDDTLLIPYGCPHDFDTPPHLVDVHRSGSLSVHTLFKRKNIFQTTEVAGWLDSHHMSLGLGHTHIGAKGNDMPINPSMVAHPIGVKFRYSCDDTSLGIAYRKSKVFICMSYEEGFSMPPMEAILHGVPYIILSDIPVHKEIYGHRNVNFAPPDCKAWHTYLGSLRRITQSDQEHFYYNYKFERLIEPFIQQLEAL